MSRGERLVSDLVNGVRNKKLTVYHATLRSHASAFITRLNRNSLPIHLLKNAAQALLKLSSTWFNLTNAYSSVNILGSMSQGFIFIMVQC